jgi:hypothetical protein
MEPIHITNNEAIVYFALVNAIVGFVLGLIPLGFGVFRGKVKLGILGIVSSIWGGAILGVFLSIPAMALFTWLIIRNPSTTNTTTEVISEHKDD